MVMARITQTLTPKRSGFLTFSRRFCVGSVEPDIDQSDTKLYNICVILPDEKRFGSKEEKEVWYHWYLSLVCGSKAAAPIINRDPRIQWTYGWGFCARLSPEDVEALRKREEFVYAAPDEKIDLRVCTCWREEEVVMHNEADEQSSVR